MIRFVPPPTAKIAACGGLITAENEVIPNIPKLLTQNEPPWYSLGDSFPSRARPAKSFILFAISDKPNLSVLKTIGVILFQEKMGKLLQELEKQLTTNETKKLIIKHIKIENSLIQLASQQQH